jgi:hypothetical protein
VGNLLASVGRGCGRTILLAALIIVAGCGSAAARGGHTGAAPAAAQPSAGTAAVKHADLLNGVSCSEGMCVAVGAYYYGTTSEQTLVERWNGSAWRLQASPNRQRYSALLAVSCATAADCTAVGSLIMRWNGAQWRITRPASPFDSVSCTMPDSCVAVGTTSRGVPVYGYWDGRTWVRGRMPGPPHLAQTVAVSGVSCASRDYCVAVGDYSYGAGAQPGSGSYRNRILAERWNGTAWRILPTVNVARIDQLSAVSCTSPGRCTAVGTSRQQFPLAERWNGRSWRVQRVPAAGRTGYTQLSAVSCGSARACLAVGNYQDKPIADSWDGTAWHLERMVRPSPAALAQPTGVSCASRVTCIAVGNDLSSARTFAEIWTGVRWRLQSTANPR